MYVATIAYLDAQGVTAETPAIRITGLSYESRDYSWYVQQDQVLLTGGPHRSLLFQLRNEKEILMSHFIFGFCLSYNSSATWNKPLFPRLIPIWPAQLGRCGRLRADRNSSPAFLPLWGG